MGKEEAARLLEKMAQTTEELQGVAPGLLSDSMSMRCIALYAPRGSQCHA